MYEAKGSAEAQKGTTMRTKEESRAKILEYLKGQLERDNNEIEYAKCYIANYSGRSGYEEPIKKTYEPEVKFGVYHKLETLEQEIFDAMWIEPEKTEVWKTYGGKYRGKRNVYTHYSRFYSDADKAMAKTVIDRMAAQGYIKISKNGHHFKILKVE